MHSVPFIDRGPYRDLFIANQMERFAQLVVSQSEKMMQAQGVEIPARSVSLMLLAGERKNLSAADIAKVLRLPHQLVTHRLQALIAAKLLHRLPHPLDGRQKQLALTPKGQRQYRQLKLCLEQERAAFDDLYTEIGSDLSQVILRSIRMLTDRPLQDRIMSKQETVV